MYIEQLIDAIKRRPGMFVKEEKIEYIYYFISGYCSANNNYLDDIDKKFSYWFLKWLRIWIENNLDPKYTPSSAYWYDDVKFVAKDKKNEVVVFYELCKKFFEDYKNKQGYFSWRN